MNRLSWLRLDSFTLAIAGDGAAGAGACRAAARPRVWSRIGSEIAIVLLFFLQGARVSRPAVLAGILHWRLHLIILAATFAVFPLLGLAMRPLSGTVPAPPLYVGLMFLCTSPSAVQSSVVFTAIAGGNVPAALCSASLSSVVGMVLTPLLVGLLLQAEGGPSLNGLGTIVTHLLLPFLAGQILQRWLDGWLQRHRRVVGLVDRAAVLLMVYGLFSAATLSGLWSRTSAESLLVVALIDGALLATMLAITAMAARLFGLLARRTRSRSCSAARRRVWSPALRWPTCCSPAPRSAWWSCR